MVTSQPHKIFTPLRIQNLILKNRIFALPLFTGYALPDHRVSPLMIEHYRRLAQTGAAVVAVPNVAIAENGRTSGRSLLLNHDKYIEGLKHLAQVIKHNGALACLQLNHAGRYAITDHPLLPSAIGTSEIMQSVSALKSFMESFPFTHRFGLTAHIAKMTSGWAHEMTDIDIEKTIKGFANAAERAYQAGFDLIELHGSTGYLISQFLSPETNRRPAPWGSSFNARIRFPLRIIHEIKQRLPEAYPLGFRLLLDDKTENGISFKEAARFAEKLQQQGVAYLSPTAGSYQSMFVEKTAKELSKPGYLRKQAKALRHHVNIPVIISGRISTPKLAESVLVNEEADMIGLGRPLLADTNWVDKAKKGLKIQGCRNCNTCFKNVVMGKPLVCVRWPQVFQDRTRLETRFYSHHGYRMLMVLSSKSDLMLARTHLQRRVPIHADMVIRQLILETGKEQGFEDSAKTYSHWSEHYLRNRLKRSNIETVYVRSNHNPVDLILRQLVDNFGIITFFHEDLCDWKEQLINRVPSDRVLIRNGNHPNIKKVLVPCDLSPFTFMQIRIALLLYHGRSDITCCFCHVTDRPHEAIEKWDKILSKTELEDSTALLIRKPSKSETTADALIKEVIRGNFGSIIIGKRGGITRIRRKLLGSVSQKLLHELPRCNFSIVG